MTDHPGGVVHEIRDGAPAGDGPPSLTEAYQLIEHERRAMARRTDQGPAIFYLTWGVVWLVAFGVMFLASGLHGSPVVAMPAYVPGIVLTVMVLAGLGTTITTSGRRQSRIGGASRQSNLMYGLSWLVAFVMVDVIAARVSDSLPTAEVTLMFSALSTAVVGTLYVAGAAMWRDRSMFVLGIWVSVVNVAGVLAGPGWHALLVAVAGGGGLLVTGVVTHLRWRRVAA